METLTVFPASPATKTSLLEIALWSSRADRTSAQWAANRELLLPTSLTKRHVNHARSESGTDGYAADWSMPQLRESPQRIADRVDALIDAAIPNSESSRWTG